jgi:xanthosine utilization system XapX-like protein
LKSIIFWDITSCRLLKDNRRFRRTYRLHLQGRRIIRARKLSESMWQLPSQALLATCFHAGFLLGIILRLCRWRRYVPPKLRWNFNGLHGVVSQKVVRFITTAVRTSDPESILWFLSLLLSFVSLQLPSYLFLFFYVIHFQMFSPCPFNMLLYYCPV